MKLKSTAGIVLALLTVLGVAARPRPSIAQSPGTYTDLHDFGGTATDANGSTGPDGAGPGRSITFDSAGNMYGTAASGGANDGGTLWEATASGVYKDLHDFGGTVIDANGTSGPDGSNPIDVTFDSAGNIYGTAFYGGPNGADPFSLSAGMVWEITANGTYKDLHDFGATIIDANGTSGADGFQPEGVMFDRAGNLFGTTLGGGTNLYDGMVWEITASGTYKDIHDFGGTLTNANGASGEDGSDPEASVTFDSAGNMYGTANDGGANYGGIVWEITSAGTYKDLHDFGGTVTNADGSRGPDGVGADAAVTFDGAGNMFGATHEGGANGGADGIMWEITSSGTYKDLHDFGHTATDADGISGPDGFAPDAAVSCDSAGNIFGTTSKGGANGLGDGIVWEMTATGTYRDLHDFGGTVTNADGAVGPDGFSSYAAVTFDKAGNLIGTTGEGGPYYDGATPFDYGGILWELVPPPSAPAAPILTATSATGGIAPITLSWNAVSGAIVYRVYRSTTSNGEANPALAGGLGTPGYTDTSTPSAGSTYYYKVTAVNANGASPFSNEAAVTRIAAAPTGLTATAYAGGLNFVALAWTASAGATGYDVYRGTSLIGWTLTPAPSYNDPNPAAGVANSYTVTAVNAGGTSAASNTATVTLSPATPATLTATAGDNKIILNWSASTGALVYRVYRSTTSGGEANPALAGGLGTTSYTDTAVVNGATNYYEVTAVNTAGASPFSTQVSATPGSGAPLAPILETVAPAAGGVAPITLTWTASAGATVYRVYRSTASGGEVNPALAGGLTTAAYTDAGALTAGTTYYYKLTAVNTGGASPFSNEKSVPLTPAPPTNVTATAATGGVAPVALAWTASAGATGYDIYRGTTLVGSTGATPAFHDATVIATGVGVSYTLTAVNAGGASAASASATVLLRPAAPLNLTGTASRSQVVLNWTASAGAVVYRVYRSTTSGGEANPALAGGIGSPGYTDTTVVSGAFYYYTVTAVNTAGASGFSNECDTPTGPVTAPPLLTATTAAGGLAPITLSWAAVPGATFYRVYRSTTSGGEGNSALAVGVTNTDFTDTAVSAGLTYYYKVTAVDAIGASAFSDEAGATLTPATPTGLLATPVAGPVVNLVWNESAGATSYNVYRGTASGLETLYTSTFGPAYADSSVAATTMYYYEVTAVNAGGQSGHSNEAQALTE